MELPDLNSMSYIDRSREEFPDRRTYGHSTEPRQGFRKATPGSRGETVQADTGRGSSRRKRCRKI